MVTSPARDSLTPKEPRLSFSGSRAEDRELLRKLRERDLPTSAERIIASLVDTVVPAPGASWHGGIGCVYFVRGVSGGAVKIGKATQGRLRPRLTSLQSGNPDILEFVRVVIDDGFLEDRLHRALAEHRIIGEWFAYDGLVVDACKSRLAAPSERSDFGLWRQKRGSGDADESTQGASVQAGFSGADVAVRAACRA